MGKEQDRILDQKVEQQKGNFRLFKVIGDRERLAVPWPADYKIPRNAAIGIGIPQNEKDPVMLAFAIYGRQHSHGYLETVTTSGRQMSGFVRAYLRSYQGKCVLEIPVLTGEDKEIAEGLGQFIDPTKLLSQRTLEIAMTVFRATEYRYTEDTRNSPLIDKAKAKNAQEAPKSGISRLIWKSKNRLEG